MTPAAVPAPASPAVPARAGRPELVLLAIAAALRVAWALVAPTDLWFDHVFNDATAWNLAQGNGFSAAAESPHLPAIFRTPGYPAFLAGVYAVVGHSVRAAYLANAVLDTAACALAWRLASADLGPRAGRWVLALAATYPFTIHAVATVSPESLLVLLTLAFVATVRAWPLEGGGRPVLATGALLGALAWIKPVYLPVPAVLLAWDLARRAPRRAALLRAAVVGSMTAAIFAPWIVRNVALLGRPVLAGEMGMVVWHGTRDFHREVKEEVAGKFAKAPEDPAARYERTRRGFVDPFRMLDKDREFLELGLAAIRERPWHAALWDPLRRVPALWISSHHAQAGPWVGRGAAAACLAYLALAAAGAWIERRRLVALGPWLVAAVALTAAYAPIHAEARYTLPARPVLWLLGGAALAAAAARLRGDGGPAGDPR